MKIYGHISPVILRATVGLLQPYMPELSPITLVDALLNYDPKENHNRYKLHSLKETAVILAISMPTLLRLIKKGTIKAVKIGNSTRVANHELERIINGGNDLKK